MLLKKHFPYILNIFPKFFVFLVNFIFSIENLEKNVDIFHQGYFKGNWADDYMINTLKFVHFTRS